MGAGRREGRGTHLANSSHLRLLQQGARAIDAWRKVNAGSPLDLSGANLSGARLAGADLSGANLADADLSDADLSEASLFGSSLLRAKLSGANLPGTTLRKADARRADFSDANLTGSDLEAADLSDAGLEKAKLGAANLTSADLKGARLAGADLGAARLRGADLRNARAAGASFAGADLQKANLLGADFKGADFTNANLQRTVLRDGTPGIVAETRPGESPEARADFQGARLTGANLEGADLTGYDLSDADLRDARLARATLVGAELGNADLGGASLEEANLAGCDFVGVRFDSTTLLRRAKVKGARIDRHTLESLKDYGGLTPGDRMQMEILDGVALLRSHYSGFWQWIHLFALLLFAYPYVSFVFLQYTAATTGLKSTIVETQYGVQRAWITAQARSKSPLGLGAAAEKDLKAALDELKPPVPSRIPLWKAVGRFIWNGGVGWEKGLDLAPLTFALFCFSFLYNALRFVMVFKTKELELHQMATGLPVPVSALGIWGRLVKTMEIGFAINVVVVIVHTAHFLQTDIVVYSYDAPPPPVVAPK